MSSNTDELGEAQRPAVEKLADGPPEGDPELSVRGAAMLRQAREAGEAGPLVDLLGLVLERFEAGLLRRAGEQAEAKVFQSRLAALSEVADELTRCVDEVALYRRAVELGRELLGFERLGIWLLDADPEFAVGTFGTGEDGSVRDERGSRVRIRPGTQFEQSMRAGERRAFRGEARLFDHHADVVGFGSVVTAALWDGESVLGCMASDTLLSGKPMEAPQVELLALYASRVGHLVARLRTEAELRASEERYRVAKEAAEAASRSKSEFLASISHEIRTPVASLLGMAEHALESAADPELRRSLEVMRAAADWLHGLVDGTLDFARVEGDRIELLDEPFSLRANLDGTMLALAPQAEAKGLALLCRVDPGVPDALRGDGVRFRQVVANLVANGIKFTDTGSVTVSVTARPAADGAVGLSIAVRDTGCGIPADLRERIFQPFVQGGGCGGAQRAGVGLGLTIASHLAGLMHGFIGVESRVGRGSQFTAALELLPDAGPADRPALPADWRGARVLLLADTSPARGIAAELLRELGLEVTAEADPAAAVRRVDEAARAGHGFRAVVADEAPGRAGQLIALTEHLPVILLVGASTPASATPEAAARVVKPVSERRLLAAIASLSAKPARLTADTNGPLRGRVLVVEDDPTNREVATVMLERLGFSADSVGSGEEALQRLSTESFDVVLLDLGLPGLSGIETAERVRELSEKAGRKTCVVGVTGRTATNDRERCREAGMEGYLPKPFRPLDLRRALYEVLTR
ncbi:MAG: response regulator [Armatimonadetes bacterium]|nr:response regulator [Armatimonadota bacterium]